METDYRFYLRRAPERAVTPAAKARHQELANLFAQRAKAPTMSCSEH